MRIGSLGGFFCVLQVFAQFVCVVGVACVPDGTGGPDTGSDDFPYAFPAEIFEESVYYRFNGFTELWVAIVGNNSYFCRIGIIDWDYEA